MESSLQLVPGIPLRFENTSLSDTQFNDVTLRSAQFVDVNLGGASFSNASMAGVTFQPVIVAIPEAIAT